MIECVRIVPINVVWLGPDLNCDVPACDIKTTEYVAEGVTLNSIIFKFYHFEVFIALLAPLGPHVAICRVRVSSVPLSKTKIGQTVGLEEKLNSFSEQGHLSY